ncbi:hypothetical protein K1X76_02475 [bacterium]|nr:hypothetical protein [bacterium]
MLNTIQINGNEDKFIAKAKKDFGFSSKKEVVLAGVQALYKLRKKELKALQMQKASLAVRKESMKINKEMSRFTTASLRKETW